MNSAKLRKLEDIIQNKGVVKPPKGYFTRADLAREWGISEQHGNRKLKKYLDSKLVEMKYFKVRSGQVVRPIPHYRIK
jgi:Fic family protein